MVSIIDHMDYLIDRLFGSSTRTALLTELFMNESKRFHIRDLSRRLSITHSALLKEVDNLEILGIVKVEKIGRMKFVGINSGIPYFKELKEIIIKTSGLKDLIYNQLSSNKAIKFCMIFGSFANGEETPESDIDVLIIGKVKVLELSKQFKQVEEKTGREVNFIVWNESQLQRRAKEKSGFLSDLINKQVIMVIGSENEFRRDARKRPD